MKKRDVSSQEPFVKIVWMIIPSTYVKTNWFATDMYVPRLKFPKEEIVFWKILSVWKVQIVSAQHQ